jgi:hypothetical protein
MTMSKPSTGTIEALFVWAIFYIFFLSCLASNLSAAHDSINYLLHISSGDHLFHQHHLLYHFFSHYWLKVLQLFFPGASEHLLVEAFTAVWGSAVMAICFQFFCNRFGLPRLLAAAALMVIAFSYGTWFYSINIEVYTPPLFFILLALYRMSAPDIERRDVWVVAVIQGAAILFHQANVLFTPVVIYWIFRQLPKDRRTSFATYFVTLFVLCGGAYAAAGILGQGHRSFGDFSSWLLGYTVGHDYWQPLSLHTPIKVLAGFSRAFIGAQFIFQLPPVRDFLFSSFLDHALEDEMFLTRNMSSTVAWSLLFFSFLIAAMVVMLAVKSTQLRYQERKEKELRRMILYTVGIYSLFFIFWMPEILEFWIMQMVLIWLLLLGSIQRIRLPFRMSAAGFIMLLAGMLFVVNYTGSIHWLNSFNNDWYYQRTTELAAGERDLVIIKDKWILKDYARYFSNADVIATDEKTFSDREIRNRVHEVLRNGGRVFTNAVDNDGNFSWVTIRSY